MVCWPDEHVRNFFIFFRPAFRGAGRDRQDPGPCPPAGPAGTRGPGRARRGAAVRTVRTERRQYVPASAASASRRPGADAPRRQARAVPAGRWPHRRAAGRPGRLRRASARRNARGHRRQHPPAGTAGRRVHHRAGRHVEGRERDAAGRAPGRGIRARPLARRAQHPRRGTGAPPGRPAGRRRDRGLLPRALLRAVQRGGDSAAGPRHAGPDWRPASRNGRPPACGWSRPTRTCTA